MRKTIIVVAMLFLVIDLITSLIRNRQNFNEDIDYRIKEDGSY
jgi:preprotein translocase subunit SecG